MDITSGGTWDLGVSIVDTAQLRDLEIVATDFGFFVREGELTQGPFALCRYRFPNTSPTILVDEEVGVAVIGGDREKAIVFGDSRKIIREALPGRILDIREMLDRNAIEVQSSVLVGVAFYRKYPLIDNQEEEVIETFASANEAPPWRE